MTWGHASIVAVVVLAVRLYLAERRFWRVHHDAANRALVRERAEAWRWRQTDWALRRIAREAAPGFDVPDLLAGPPDDPPNHPGT